MGVGMNKKLGPLAFFRALHERRVWGLAAAYLVVGFGLFEASELVFPRLQLSPAAVNVVLAVLLFAFPVALLESPRVHRRLIELSVAGSG